VAQVDHLGTAGLQDAAHNVNGSIVPIKKRGGGYKTDFILRSVGRYAFHAGVIGSVVKLTKFYRWKSYACIIKGMVLQA
jgi:hypothetical protein